MAESRYRVKHTETATGIGFERTRYFRGYDAAVRCADRLAQEGGWYDQFDVHEAVGNHWIFTYRGKRENEQQASSKPANNLDDDA